MEKIVLTRPLLPSLICDSSQSTAISEGPHKGQRRVSVRTSQTASGDAAISLQITILFFLSDIIVLLNHEAGVRFDTCGQCGRQYRFQFQPGDVVRIGAIAES